MFAHSQRLLLRGNQRTVDRAMRLQYLKQVFVFLSDSAFFSFSFSLFMFCQQQVVDDVCERHSLVPGVWQARAAFLQLFHYFGNKLLVFNTEYKLASFVSCTDAGLFLHLC